MGARITFSAGRPGARPAERPRRSERVTAALTAAGELLLPTYEMTQGTDAGRVFEREVIETGYREIEHVRWPSEAEAAVDKPGGAFFREGPTTVYRLEDGTVALLNVGGGWCRLSVAAPSRASLGLTVGAFQSLYPATYLDATGDRVPITFWMNGTYGPIQRLRMLDAAPWAEIARNYPGDVREKLERLVDPAFEPGKDGQLLLWQGPPGTGKTWALRALASEWLPWAEFHYITDPDSFFVEKASYMVDVLLSESYEAISSPDSSDVFEQEDPGGKWRVLILEDTGELLSATAKEKYGQGLSRLLNVVDGMIGQGLRILVLVTTNDELGALNPAVMRPGRCASQIVFGAFSAAEASEWLGETVEKGGTVAELYARRGESTDALTASSLHAPRFRFGNLAASGGLCAPVPSQFDADRVVAEVGRVAGDHADEAIGYGETAYSSDKRTVYWIHGDWTDCAPAKADFLAIDGVDAFVCEAEAIPDGWWDAQVVYPDQPPRWVTERPEQAEAALAEVVELAARPLE